MFDTSMRGLAARSKGDPVVCWQRHDIDGWVSIVQVKIRGRACGWAVTVGDPYGAAYVEDGGAPQEGYRPWEVVALAAECL